MKCGTVCTVFCITVNVLYVDAPCMLYVSNEIKEHINYPHGIQDSCYVYCETWISRSIETLQMPGMKRRTNGQERTTREQSRLVSRYKSNDRVFTQQQQRIRASTPSITFWPIRRGKNIVSNLYAHSSALTVRKGPKPQDESCISAGRHFPYCRAFSPSAPLWTAATNIGRSLDI